MNAVPVYEAKNRLPFFIHKAETESPVAISRRDKVVAFIISKDDYEALNAGKKKSLVDSLQEKRKKYGLEDDDFDFSAHLESIKEVYYGRAEDEHIFEGV